MPTPRSFTAEEYLSLKRPDSPTAAPDGAVCAFVVAEADFIDSRVVAHLWVAEPDSGEARQITFSHEGEEAPAFSPDGSWLAFLSARPDYTRPEPELEEGDEPRPQLWILPAAGGEARCLTDQREGVRDFDWLPDSAGLLYLAEEARPKSLEAHHLAQRRARSDAVIEPEERRRIGIWRVETGNDGENERVWAGDPGGHSISVSPDGTKAVYETNYSGEPNDYAKIDLWIVDLSAGQARQLTDRPGAEWAAQWSPDGTRIAFFATIEPGVSYSQAQVWVIPVEGGEMVRLLPDFDAEIEQFLWPRESPDTLLFTASIGLSTSLFRLDVPTGAIEPFAIGEGVCSSFDASSDGRDLFLIWETGTQWPDVYRIDGGSAEDQTIDAEAADAVGNPIENVLEVATPEIESGGPMVRISDLNPDWREVALAPQRSFRWECDGLDIEGLLVVPAGASDRPSPLVVYLHGGPHGSTKDSIRQGFPLQWLAQHGYAVLAPNYRGSDNGGATFAVANRRDLGGGDYRDVIAGVDAAIAAGIADPDRLAVMGGSYGGYLTNWAISQTERFRAAVSMFGIFNWITDFSNSEISDFEREYLGGYYWEDPELYLERSPFRYVDRIRTPVLILHGESDSNTFISNSREMYQALRALGRTVSFVRYPREGHGFIEPQHRCDELRRVLAWLDAHLLGEGTEKPAVHRIGQKIGGREGWSIRVTAVDVVSPAGHKEPEETALVQVTFVLSTDQSDARLDIKLDEIRVEAEGRACPFAGVPISVLDEVILVAGTDQRAAFHQADPPAAFPVAAVYRAPKGPAEITLVVPGFPPIVLPLPRGEKEDEPERAEGSASNA